MPQSPETSPADVPPGNAQSRFGRREMWGFVLLLVTTLGIGYAAVRRVPWIEDERFHVQQVRWLATGNYALHPMLTTLPGHHAILAGVVRLTGEAEVHFLRLLSVLLAAGCVAAFSVAYRHHHGKFDFYASGQLLYLPVLFPYFFLVYTDVTGLLLVLLALICFWRGYPLLAGVLGILSMTVRQDNVVWLGFLLLLLIARRRTHRLRDAAGVVLGLVLFAFFVLLNRGVAIGDKTAHPFPALGLTNVYLALWLLFLLYPFGIATSLRRIADRLRRRRWPWLALAAIAIVYFFTLSNTHPYNRSPDEYLHNRLLVFATSGVSATILLFVPAAMALLWLWMTPILDTLAVPLYACGTILLAGRWLVEPRYTIVPFALLLLLRERGSARVERLTLIWNAALAWLLFWGVASGRVFP